MSALAKHILAMANDAHFMGHPEWQRGEPRKDGKPIVAMGHILSRWADGASVDPFVAEIQWSKDESGYEGWHYASNGLCVAVMMDDEVHVRRWIDLLPEGSQGKGADV